MEYPLVRHPANPVLRADHVPEPGILVFNPGVCRRGDAFVMAYRCDEGRSGDPHITGSAIRFADSPDGIDWTPRPGPGLDRAAMLRLLQPLEPHRNLDPALWRCYDPRLTSLDGGTGPRYALTFAADTTVGLRAGLALSDDTEHWTAVSLGAPDSRNHVLFPERIDGHRWRLERPMQEYGGEALGAGRYAIWAGRSPDLRHWGDTRLVVSVDDLASVTQNGPAPVKIGPGTPPVRTAAGWLCLIHVVHELGRSGSRGWEAEWDKRYDAWAVLLDLDDPSKLLAVRGPVLSPQTTYEREGFRNDVIFPTGAVVVDHDGVAELWTYYGAADTSIALATAPLDDLVAWTRAGPSPSTIG